MLPTPGMVVFTLTNGVKCSFWYENDSQSLWFIYQVPGEPEYRGGGLNFQLGKVYVDFMGGPGAYLDVCIAKINAKIKELFPALFGAIPTPAAPTVPPEIEQLGPESVFFVKWLNDARLVDNQIVR